MDNTQLSARLGVFVQPGIGQAYPELVQLMRLLYRDRVAKLAFVPGYWWNEVSAAMAGGDMVLLTPTGFKSLAYPVPPWLSDDLAAMAAWQKASDVVRDVQMNFTAGKIAEGRAEMASAQSKVEFWDGLYKAAVVVRDLPGQAVATVAKGAASAAGSFLGKTWWVWLVVGAISLAWLGRGAIANAAINRVTK